MSKPPRIAFVVAMARNRAIGAKGGLPWRLSNDLKRFKAITMGKPVIMGRKTWESLPRRPLPGRVNIVVTRQPGYSAPEAVVAATVADALARAAALVPEEICVIGGGEIFAVAMPYVHRMYLSEIALDTPGDTFFPAFGMSEWRETARETFERQPGEPAGFVLRTLDRVGPARQY